MTTQAELETLFLAYTQRVIDEAAIPRLQARFVLEGLNLTELETDEFYSLGLVCLVTGSQVMLAELVKHELVDIDGLLVMRGDAS